MVEVVYPYRAADPHNPKITFPDGEPVYYLLGYLPFKTVSALAGGATVEGCLPCQKQCCSI